ncbi:hypothetical protein DIS24_g5012 [Lasiodiplodia hormozganensis]|uniref:DUF8035 domain-containing protein n=1 Tax=Lasiodiplodia hormozganensis TaxID=869390 RepID=A0AA39YL31_9PEZI|nr:hypothetical protein DIS24_g5012 [Lasiodiplodia hormozganensis]
MAFGYRSSTGALDRFDDYEPPPRRPERWDREKFERMSRRPPHDDRETFRWVERERDDYPPRPPRSRPDVALEDRVDARSSRGRFDERDRFYDDDIIDRRGPGRRPEFLDREEPSPAEIASRALAPYRRKTVTERDLSPPARRPARPAMLRRQSSLDTFDRRPLRRHEEREEWRPPTNIDIPLPIRRRSPSRRRRSPPRDRYREDDFEEIRYRDAEPDYREDYREVEIRREKSRARKSHRSDRSERSESRYRAPSKAPSRAPSRAPSSKSSSSSFEEIREVSPSQLPGKKGKTRMPKRLVHKSAIIQLGYPFEEEEDFLIVKRALEKPQIDEVIKISETYKAEDNKRTTYRYEEEKMVDVPMPPPPPSVHGTQIIEVPPPPPPPMSSHEPVIVAPPPPPPSSHHTHQTHYSHHSHHSPPPPPRSVRTVSPPRREIYEERIEESNHIGGPLTVVVPERRSDREIKDEIRRLENERRALQLERRADELRLAPTEYRETEYEIIEERPRERNVIRVDKDRKVRSRSRPPNPKLVAAMMSTLT